ncbi:ketopantoate hydroxymethyltransferase [Mesorhizobium sp. M7A.F.Ca.CA.001.09.2.1]|uniref:3-methyl-2-oxobutanoate hydroxymethyltransferase n=4 Tax=Mesorhizobium TaxID=68287 RepID=A0AB38TIP3_9HYPH|nr:MULTISPECIES: 3-methyl-2-oxobutanoate hydroxymethyltransferase [Mesorhizobium]RUY53662.1 ketopantoate hydroxymethyltransferase [Mesorhizobium sp. M7A.F.Ca.CA.001.13.2.1]MDF3212336.1 3-methyl-2-oxobutanoate hydroxymethyltransferase [Mesorhizobium ciceri]RUY77197.1 ketopantoate hydroxymethyltransferase [Mesorhizobium sp. M7A.F.Ca.CA.001.09.2.1]RUZ04286.1 ketopantoate hydroxymethyltransferase [Mesorhizobium sp. M7A.F.Ca.CA.001.04.2.1]RUZ19181.1 ketopantoate hydroxymethyltransferase [Mesorhizob
MARIFDFGGREVERSVTVAGLRALKGSGRRIAQVTAETAEEAAAAEAAGIEMVVCRAANVPRVREGSRRVFVTAALGFADAVTSDEILRTAFSAITAGADAVITGRGLDTVRMLANEQIPVMGHLGFVPRKSTWVGGIRAVGKTSAEALDLWDRFRRLEDAGAFAVECEIIAAEVMAEINRRTSLVTVSLGSGAEADVVFLFTSDICGESARLPRHARAWGDLAVLQKAVRDARVEALSGFRNEVAGGSYPGNAEVAGIAQAELDDFRERLESERD